MKEKLVRDLIPNRFPGGQYRQATEEELPVLLRHKLVEEAEEFLEKGDIEELADVMEVLLELLYGTERYSGLERVREHKKDRRGAFKERWVLMQQEKRYKMYVILLRYRGRRYHNSIFAGLTLTLEEAQQMALEVQNLHRSQHYWPVILETFVGEDYPERVEHGQVWREVGPDGQPGWVWVAGEGVVVTFDEVGTPTDLQDVGDLTWLDERQKLTMQLDVYRHSLQTIRGLWYLLAVYGPDEKMSRELRGIGAVAQVRELDPPRPTVVTLCGSRRHKEAYRQAHATEALEGRMVLSGAVFPGDPEFISPDEPGGKEQEERLHQLHLQNILFSDEILVLNVEGYVGEGTREKIFFARSHMKRVRFWEPDRVPEDLRRLQKQHE